MTTARLVSEAIDVARVLESVAGPGRGGTVLFLGTVRDVHERRAVRDLAYSAYEAMAVEEMDRILAEAQGRFPECAVAVAHRVGTLAIGDISIAVAAAHAHRGPAFDAARWTLDQVKERVPIWKRERYADGTAGWVGTPGEARAER